MEISRKTLKLRPNLTQLKTELLSRSPHVETEGPTIEADSRMTLTLPSLINLLCNSDLSPGVGLRLKLSHFRMIISKNYHRNPLNYPHKTRHWKTLLLSAFLNYVLVTPSASSYTIALTQLLWLLWLLWFSGQHITEKNIPDQRYTPVPQVPGHTVLYKLTQSHFNSSYSATH